MKTLLLAVLGGLVLLEITAVPAQALEYINGHVTMLEPTYMPGKFALQLDAGPARCKAGTWLYWEKPAPENVRAVYAAALAALISGKKVNFVVNQNDPSCQGQFFHLTLQQ